jgi:hypothetical protein
MLASVTDWATISSLATAAGTLVLALATFASVRSANRAARAAEQSLLVGLRPVLMPSRWQDPGEKIGFMDEHWVKVTGGHGLAEVTDEAIYLAIALRNVGSGLAVLHGWFFYPERLLGDIVTRTRRRSAACPETCTCRPGTSASGKAPSAIHPSRGSPKPGMRSKMATASPWTCSMAIMREVNG